jgi:hypothetical protein
MISDAGGGGHAYNPGTWEAEAGGSQVLYQPVLYSKTWSQKKKKKVDRILFSSVPI